MLSRKSVLAKSVTALNFNWDEPITGVDEPVLDYSDASVVRVDFGDMPSPVNFDKFIPWVANEMDLIETFAVKRVVVGDYIPISSSRKKPKKKARALSLLSNVSKGSISLGIHTPQLADVSKTKSPEGSKDLVNIIDLNLRIVPVTAFYDTRDRLIEVAVMPNEYLSQKLIKVIDLAVPFHTNLTKFTVTNGPVKQEVVYQIGELLPLSTITEVCLDQTYVKQGNYYTLLNNSRLKRLSLNRCSINDVILEEITTRLSRDSRVSETLQILELSSNFITDLGACLIANLLRRNRKILHLNLAGNRITSDGAAYILDALVEFRLTESEWFEASMRKRYYHRRRLHIFNRCLQEQMKIYRKRMESISLASQRKKSIYAPVNPKMKFKSFDEIKLFAEMQTDHLMGGPFRDPYDKEHITSKNDLFYCTGNFRLCSLNLGYNALDYFVLKKVLKVLRFQHAMTFAPGETGLLRIILVGNYLPEDCIELQTINSYLKDAVYSRAPEKMAGRNAI